MLCVEMVIILMMLCSLMYVWFHAIYGNVILMMACSGCMWILDDVILMLCLYS